MRRLTRRLKLFGIIALLTAACGAAQARTAAGITVPATPAKPQKAAKSVNGAASLASINAELDRLQKQLDDLRQQVAALEKESKPAPMKP